MLAVGEILEAGGDVLVIRMGVEDNAGEIVGRVPALPIRPQLAEGAFVVGSVRNDGEVSTA